MAKLAAPKSKSRDRSPSNTKASRKTAGKCSSFPIALLMVANLLCLLASTPIVSLCNSISVSCRLVNSSAWTPARATRIGEYLATVGVKSLLDHCFFLQLLLQLVQQLAQSRRFGEHQWPTTLQCQRWRYLHSLGDRVPASGTNEQGRLLWFHQSRYDLLQEGKCLEAYTRVLCKHHPKFQKGDIQARLIIWERPANEQQLKDQYYNSVNGNPAAKTLLKAQFAIDNKAFIVS